MAKNNKPKAIALQYANKSRPKTKSSPQPKRWTFSFRFWDQIDNFGLSKSNPKWFVSVIERLKDMSKISVDEIQASVELQDSLRFHPINWTQKNIPIQRKDLTWLESDYLTNEDEYPIVQFTISKALGRVVGFFDEQKVFNIVLLDPLHNIQPSKRFEYRVDKCFPLSCLYTSLLGDVETLKKTTCIEQTCPLHQTVQELPKSDHKYTAVILRLSEAEYQDAIDAMEIDPTLTIEIMLGVGVLYSIVK